MASVSATPACIVQVELAAGSSADGIVSALNKFIDDSAGMFETRPMIDVVSGFGARRSTAAVLMMATFAAGVAQGVAGNAVWQMIQRMSAGAGASASVNGTPVDAASADQALSRIEHILIENRCLRPTDG